jgi:hypothetical protein
VDGPGDAGEVAAFLHGHGGGPVIVADASVGAKPPGEWIPNELVQSRHRIAVPADQETGPLVIRAGLYTRSNLQRLPVRSAAGALPEDQVELGVLEVRRAAVP